MLKDKRKVKMIQKISSFTLFGCVMVWLLLVAFNYWNKSENLLSDLTLILFVITGGIAVIDAVAVFIFQLVIDVQEIQFKQAVQKWIKDFLFGVVAGAVIVLLFDDNRESLFHIGMLWSILEYGAIIWFGCSLGKFWSRKFPEKK